MKTIIKTAAIFLLLLSNNVLADTEVTALSAKQQILALEKDNKVQFPIVRNPVDLMGKPIIVSTSENNNTDALIVPVQYRITTGR
jgi:hypothetical protein